jgi:hypothetical protein
MKKHKTEREAKLPEKVKQKAQAMTNLILKLLKNILPCLLEIILDKEKEEILVQSQVLNRVRAFKLIEQLQTMTNSSFSFLAISLSLPLANSPKHDEEVPILEEDNHQINNLNKNKGLRTQPIL